MPPGLEAGGHCLRAPPTQGRRRLETRPGAGGLAPVRKEALRFRDCPQLTACSPLGPRHGIGWDKRQTLPKEGLTQQRCSESTGLNTLSPREAITILIFALNTFSNEFNGDNSL